MKLFEYYFNPKSQNDRAFDNFSFDPKGDKEKARGSLYMAGELKHALPDRASFLKELAQVIRKHYYEFQGPKGKPAVEAAFRYALKRANEFLQEETKKDHVDWIGNLNFAVLALPPGFEHAAPLYFAKTGQLEIRLGRNGTLTDIAEKAKEDPAGKVFSTILTGKVQPGDRILLAPKELLSKLTKEQMVQDLVFLADEKQRRQLFKSKEKKFSKATGFFFLLEIEEFERILEAAKPDSPFPVLGNAATALSSAAGFVLQKKIALLGLLLLAAVGAWLLVNGFQQRQEEAAIQQVVVQIEKLQSQGNEARDRQQDQQAVELYGQAFSLIQEHKHKGSAWRDILLSLEQGIQRELDELGKSVRLTDPEVFAQVDSLENPKRIALTGTSLVAFTPGAEEIVIIDKDDKEQNVISSPQLLIHGVPFGDGVGFIGGSQLFLLLADSGWQEQLLETPGSFGADEAASYLGNLYVLDKKTGTILKYPDIARGPSFFLEWMKKTSSKQPKGSLAFAVSRDIWTVSEDGSVQRYFTGEYQESFTPPVYPRLGSEIRLAVQLNLPYLFILDTENSRIVILTEKGAVARQYHSSAFQDLRDFAVSPDGSEMIVLDGNTLFRIPLNL